LDKPLLIQYLRYMGRLIRLDFDYSMKYQDRKVEEILIENLPYSLSLGFFALLFSLLSGIPLGLTASRKPGGLLDKFVNQLSVLFISFPAIIFAPVSILILSFVFKIFPAGLWGGPGHLILPVMALSMPFMARIILLTREKATSAANSEFVLAARARGVSERKIFYTHILKNSLIPVTAFVAPGAAALLTGSLVVELIFVLPGLGKYFVQAAFNRDRTLIIGVIIVYSTMLVFLNMFADIIGKYLDPRTRKEGGKS